MHSVHTPRTRSNGQLQYAERAGAGADNGSPLIKAKKEREKRKEK
jgi:hypothetical protein